MSWRGASATSNTCSNEPGGLLHTPPQGFNRIDNPRLYRVLYVGDTRSGVCAEVFYRGVYRVAWNAKMLRALPNGHRRVLAWYELHESARLCVLDDPLELQQRRLRPSLVIARDYAITQRWAQSIHQERRFAGIAWWSHCEARWTTAGLWDHDCIESWGFEELRLDHPAIVEAACVVGVRVETAA